MTQAQAAPMVHYWAFGDLHYRAIKPWHDFHTARMALMFNDLRALWQAEERPAFCASPGDIIETCARANYELARQALAEQLADVPFYPGVGNHEYYGPDGEDPAQMAETFAEVWQRPLRYAWRAAGIGCIMLDYPNPFTLEKPALVYLSSETLTFLDRALEEYQGLPVAIFLHCPLRDTVLDRDPEQHRDFNSRENFFSPENSQEVRAILARRGNARFFIGGHTHTGWEAPNIVVTEQLGGHPVTFVNLMSPWYTGNHTGPRLSDDRTSFTYRPDTPDVIPSFSFRIYHDHATIRVRDHRSQSWLKEWRVPV